MSPDGHEPCEPAGDDTHRSILNLREYDHKYLVIRISDLEKLPAPDPIPGGIAWRGYPIRRTGQSHTPRQGRLTARVDAKPESVIPRGAKIRCVRVRVTLAVPIDIGQAGWFRAQT